MKIGLIVPGFSAHEAEWSIPVLLNYVRALALEHEVHVFSLRYPYHQKSYSVAGTTVHALGGGTVAGLGRFPLMLAALSRIAAVQRGGRFDLLHGLWADEPGFLAVSAGRWWGVPVVVSVMGGELVGLPDSVMGGGYGGQLSRINRWLTAQALRRAQRVTVGSSYLYALAKPHIASAKLPPNRIRRMPLGVDTTLFTPGKTLGNTPATPLAGGKIKLLHVASLSPVKDQRTLLEAVAWVVAELPGVHLHMVGDGPLRADLEQWAARHGLSAHLSWHGAVSHEQLPAYYRAADLCVMSSRFESQGMVVLEAAACGRATVGTAVGLLPELGMAARVAPAGHARALSEAILSVLRKPSLAREMGERARAYVESGYTLAHGMRELSTLYAELVG